MYVIYAMLLSYLWLLLLADVVAASIETYKIDEFPQDKIALHFGCVESDMFATNCACHITCKNSNCDNAIDICTKYSNLGCKYLLFRNIGQKKVATLKREPNSNELKSFSLGKYPMTDAAYSSSSYSRNRDKKKNKNVNIAKIVKKFKLEKEFSNFLLQQKLPAYCGAAVNTSADVVSIGAHTIGIVALNYHAPLTLQNSLRTWNSSGLLEFADEKTIILNDPLPVEKALSVDYGLTVLEPKDIANARVRKENVLTIGAAFYYALALHKADYILFLENDFKMDTALSQQEIAMQLLRGVSLLERGVEIVRLQSKKGQGCGTFKDCDHHGIRPKAADPTDRVRNWFAFYCADKIIGNKNVYDCNSNDQMPKYRCFTSWDSNWSLNAILVKRESMLNKEYNTKEGRKSIGQIALGCSQRQDAFEMNMAFHHVWMQWRVPMCISVDGMFLHEEIETSA